MINLLEETIEVLANNGKKLEDAVWIGSEDGYITLETFKKLANVMYDDGFGSAEVAQDLVIIGDSWYLTRGEYDGSEWWDFHSMDLFKKPENEIKVKSLVGGMWDTLKDINKQ